MVFGLYLCKGDLSPEACHDCVIFATKDTRSRCPGGKEFLIQYDECMLGYSDRNIFMDTVTTTSIITWNTQNVTADQSDRFNDAVVSLMKKSAEEAANSTSKKFAVEKSDFSSSQSLYASVQCIPDLTSEDCVSCLQQSIKELYFNKVGGRFLVPSCNSRYEVYPFYKETVEGTVLPPTVSAPPLPLVLAPPLPPGKGKNSKVIIIGIVVPVAICVLLFVAVFSFHVRKRAKKPSDTEVANDDSRMQSQLDWTTRFGVLVLEIISGKKNSSLYQMDASFGNLVTYTWRLWSDGSPLELVDSSFRESYQRNEIIRCIHIALLCVQEDTENRPTMSAIVQMLTTSSIALDVPQPPGFFFRSKHEEAGPSMDKSSLCCSIDAASITIVAPR
ncbi:unnamed protein product [Arabidopsis arenosa]|uniref:Gnk2-homologous domain-containing protein n=1 Tax=Arabidopsis arenosa TaxID=38785 RepID=A0A8S2B2L1_ARAAE|nr:unnamed protein product [Arabidopsis arenosa]